MPLLSFYSGTSISGSSSDESTRTTPFYRPSTSCSSWYENSLVAQLSIDGIADFDASPYVVIILVHDNKCDEIFPLFPTATLNGWKNRGGEKEAALWYWVDELPRGGKSARNMLLDA